MHPPKPTRLPVAQVTCSTPFGDIDECTGRRMVRIDGGFMCSTPFGDIDECTYQTSSGSPSVRCAQRLSATLMNAPAKRCTSCAHEQCSTPFGDIDECTFSAVRNASSCVSCSTPFGDIDECTLRPAKSGDAWSSGPLFKHVGNVGSTGLDRRVRWQARGLHVAAI